MTGCPGRAYASAAALCARSALVKDPEFIADISALWVPRQRKNVVRSYLRRLAGKRDLDDGERDRLDEAVDRLHDLRDYPFKAVEPASSGEEEQVAEVFVRINSEGVTLSQADFILTLMSVFWEKGRRQLEDFSRGCKVPTLSAASPFNWYIQPSRQRRCCGYRSRLPSAGPWPGACYARCPATAAGAAVRSNPPVLTSPASSHCTELNPPPRRPLPAAGRTA